MHVMRVFAFRVAAILAALVAASVNASAAVGASRDSATIRVEVIDGLTQETVSARLQVTDTSGRAHIPASALAIPSDCGHWSLEGKFRPVRYTGDAGSILAAMPHSVFNPFVRKEQFYTAGRSTLDLPAGSYELVASRGPLFYPASAQIELGSSQTKSVRLVLRPLKAQLPQGWYSGDAHLHAPRLMPELDQALVEIMRAENLNVAMALQIGRADTPATSPQSRYGSASAFQSGDYLIVSGQENLRTHLLGHTLTYGGKRLYHDPDSYLLYWKAWEEARRDGAINGIAHFGHLLFPSVPDPVVPILASRQAIDFIEVLQFNRAEYRTWYDLLNLGLRVIPTAGSDFPCQRGTIPGRERLFARVDGPLSADNWLEAIRAGRVFVTTGPLLDFRVSGKGAGEEVQVSPNDPVRIQGVVYFQPQKNRPLQVQVIVNGDVAKVVSQNDESGVIRIDHELTFQDASWVALRVNDETNLFPQNRPSQIAHSGAVYISVRGGQRLVEQPTARRIARAWSVGLNNLATQLSDPDQTLYLQLLDAEGDPLPTAAFASQRRKLLEEVRAASDRLLTIGESK
jgi:hypothetical protein